MDDLSPELYPAGGTGTCEIHLYNMTSFSAPLDNTIAEEKVDFSTTCYIKTSVEYQTMKKKICNCRSKTFSDLAPLFFEKMIIYFAFSPSNYGFKFAQVLLYFGA